MTARISKSRTRKLVTELRNHAATVARCRAYEEEPGAGVERLRSWEATALRRILRLTVELADGLDLPAVPGLREEFRITYRSETGEWLDLGYGRYDTREEAQARIEQGVKRGDARESCRVERCTSFAARTPWEVSS